MTAAELSCQVLDLRNIHLHENDYWSCWEINEKEEIGKSIQIVAGEDETPLYKANQLYIVDHPDLPILEKEYAH